MAPPLRSLTVNEVVACALETNTCCKRSSKSEYSCFSLRRVPVELLFHGPTIAQLASQMRKGGALPWEPWAPATAAERFLAELARLCQRLPAPHRTEPSGRML